MKKSLILHIGVRDVSKYEQKVLENEARGLSWIGGRLEFDLEKVEHIEYELFKTLDAEQCEDHIRNIERTVHMLQARSRGIKKALKELTSGRQSSGTRKRIVRSPRSPAKRVRKV
jgi:hypothetical protein